MDRGSAGLEPYERPGGLSKSARTRNREGLKAYVEKARLHPGPDPFLPGDELMVKEGKTRMIGG